MNQLTVSQENYLKAIYELLQLDGSGVQITDIASYLGITKASASVAVKNLKEKGLVSREANRLVSLTPEGEKQAKRVVETFSTLKDFLTEKLEVDPATASLEACAMEHLVSEETENAIKRLLKLEEN